MNEFCPEELDGSGWMTRKIIQYGYPLVQQYAHSTAPDPAFPHDTREVALMSNMARLVGGADELSKGGRPPGSKTGHMSFPFPMKKTENAPEAGRLIKKFVRQVREDLYNDADSDRWPVKRMLVAVDNGNGFKGVFRSDLREELGDNVTVQFIETQANTPNQNPIVDRIMQTYEILFVKDCPSKPCGDAGRVQEAVAIAMVWAARADVQANTALDQRENRQIAGEKTAHRRLERV